MRSPVHYKTVLPPVVPDSPRASRPSLLAFSEHFDPLHGGTVTYVKALLRALVRRGWHVSLVTSSPRQDIPNRRWTSVEDGVDMYNIAPRSSLSYNTRRSRRALYHALKRELPDLLAVSAPDVVHVLYGHLLPGLFRNVPASIPRVWTIHNVPPREYGPLLRAPIPFLHGIGNRLYLSLVGQIHAFRIRRFASSLLLAVSEHTANTLRSIGVADDRVACVHNGVEPTLFFPYPVAENTTPIQNTGLAGSPILLMVAGIAPHKRQENIIRALPILRRLFPRVMAYCLGATRDAAYERFLRRLADDLQVSAHFKLLPSQAAETTSSLVQMLNTCDVYVHSSREEGFGLSVLEALACGVPVVATETGGIPQMCEGISQARLVPIDDIPAFARAIAECATLRPSLTDRRTAHERIVERYSWDRVAEETERVYAHAKQSVSVLRRERVEE